MKLRGLPPLAAAAVVLPGQKNLSWLPGVALFAILLISWTAGTPLRATGRTARLRAATAGKSGRVEAGWTVVGDMVRRFGGGPGPASWPSADAGYSLAQWRFCHAAPSRVGT